MSSKYKSTSLTVPCGWKRGEPLVISKQTIHRRPAWFVEQKPNFNFNAEIKADHIGVVWFYTFEELAEFLRWWNEDN